MVEQLESYLFYVLYTGTPSKDLEKQYAVQALEMRKIASMADGPAKLVAIDAFVQTHWQSFMNTKARRSEEHTSELQSLMRISYAVFCLKKKQKIVNILASYTYNNKTIQYHHTNH